MAPSLGYPIYAVCGAHVFVAPAALDPKLRRAKRIDGRPQSVTGPVSRKLANSPVREFGEATTDLDGTLIATSFAASGGTKIFLGLTPRDVTQAGPPLARYTSTR